MESGQENRDFKQDGLSSNDMSSADFKLMLQDLADEAEHKLPGPPPKVQRLYSQQKKKHRKLVVIFLVSLSLLITMVFWGIKNADNLPLGLGGILKAYIVGTKAPVPEPGKPISPSQKPKPLDPSRWGK